MIAAAAFARERFAKLDELEQSEAWEALAEPMALVLAGVTIGVTLVSWIRATTQRRELLAIVGKRVRDLEINATLEHAELDAIRQVENEEIRRMRVARVLAANPRAFTEVSNGAAH